VGENGKRVDAGVLYSGAVTKGSVTKGSGEWSAEMDKLVDKFKVKGSWMLEMVSRGWVDLDEYEKRVFEEWLVDAKGYDLYILLRHAVTYQKRSSVMNMMAVNGARDGEGDS
jgi:hypothetical protein